MQSKSDAQLLHEYAEAANESAFSEIVSRYTNLVYSAAMRQTNSPEAAADISQSVFVSLARTAKTLLPSVADDASLAGWLCRSARNLSLTLLRDEIRRHSRERQAMDDVNLASESATDWDRIRPVLDEAMSELSEPDYEAVVIRFFNNEDLRAVGRALGVSDDAAQKRVSRALEKLRESLSKRGISTTATAASAVLSANAVQTAPAGLFQAFTAAAFAGTAVQSSTVIAATKAIALTTLQKASLAAVVVVCLGVAIYETTRSPKRGPVFSVGDAQKLLVPYTVEFAVQSQWHVGNQVRDDQRVETRVSVGLNQLMIQSRSPTNEMLGPMTWATSPFRTNEWIWALPPSFSGTNDFGSTRFNTVQIDQRPYTGMDELTRLALFL